MSITITTDVFCDGDDCRAWTDGVTGPRPDSRAARVIACQSGWARIGNRDLCPECAPKEAQP